MDVVEIIRAKREGRQLSPSQIDWVIDAYVRGAVAEEQMAALAMAICWRGLQRTELACWTQAMVASGRRLDLSGLGRPTVDKHSTGGVGDKVTLALTPLVAACGVAVPQLSGRGLGHTGGTLDKLEAIPGWRSDLTHDQFMAQLGTVGAVIAAAGPELAPADARLYALRDVTGTVESIPLIAASVMSKKVAEGTAALVLDVKVGSGAFMSNLAQARLLAEAMVELGSDAGVLTSALLTDMSAPLGRAVGNAVEVAEAVEVLAGGGPRDVVDLTVALATEMLALAGRDDLDPAELLRTGHAMDAWRALLRAQGADPDAALPLAPEQHILRAERAGIVTGIDAFGVGIAAWRLGAGRERRGDAVSAVAGVHLHVERGARVRVGDQLATASTEHPDRLPAALAVLAGAFTVSETPTPVPELILDRLAA